MRDHARELSEIDEEIIQYVLLLIVRQAEGAWHLPEQSLTSDRRVKSALLNQFFPANEKVTVVNFEVMIAEKPSSFRLVFPTAFAGYLMKQIKLDQPQKKGAVRHFPTPPIRERILDCDMEVATELTGLKSNCKGPDCASARFGSKASGSCTVSGDADIRWSWTL